MDDDLLRPARGCLYGVLLGMAVMIGVVWLLMVVR